MINLLEEEFPRSSRSNVLVHCSGAELHRMHRDLVDWCGPLVRVCPLPGPLDLPADFTGTVLVTHVEEMSPDQQVALFDWITQMHATARVVSVATTRLDRLVREGLFLEDLFYRLNVVQTVVGGDRTIAEPALNGASCRA